MLGKLLQGQVELPHRGRLEPLLEAEQTLGIARHAKRRRQGGGQDARLLALPVPSEQHLRLGGEHSFERGLALAQTLGLARCRLARLVRGLLGTQARYRRADRKGNDAEIDAEGEEDARVDAARIRRRRREGRQHERRGKDRDQAQKHLLPP